MTTWLKCSECDEMFEVSSSIADAMLRWEEESGDPIICCDCFPEDPYPVLGEEKIHERKT